MKVAIFTPNFPYPLTSGGNQAQFDMLEILRKHIDITLIFPYRAASIDDQKTLMHSFPNIKFKPITSPFQTRLRTYLFKKALALSNYRGTPAEKLISQQFLTPQFANSALSSIINDPPDIIQVEFLPFIQLGALFPRHPKLFIHHEIGFIKNKRILDSQENSNSYTNYIQRREQHFEIACLNTYNKILTLTEIDAQQLQSHGVTATIQTSPIVIPLDLNQKNPHIYNNSLTFLGGDKHPPNERGLNWFLDAVWSKILERFPQTQLRIIGSWSESKIDHILRSHANISFTGFVKDLSPHLANSIMITPILDGSGIRMKIIEAVKNSVPVISTTIGIEGIPFRNNEECLIADSPKEFTDATNKLIASQQLRNRLIEKSNSKIRSTYSPQKSVEARLKAYTTLLESQERQQQ